VCSSDLTGLLSAGRLNVWNRSIGFWALIAGTGVRAAAKANSMEFLVICGRTGGLKV